VIAGVVMSVSVRDADYHLVDAGDDYWRVYEEPHGVAPRIKSMVPKKYSSFFDEKARLEALVKRDRKAHEVSFERCQVLRLGGRWRVYSRITVGDIGSEVMIHDTNGGGEAARQSALRWAEEYDRRTMPVKDA
jgi:membrane protein implicated in regulation of membrane protease activity